MATHDIDIEEIRTGKVRSLARALTMVENELPGSSELLRQLSHNPDCRVVGITGPPGAGKSTLINAMLDHLTLQGKKVAVLSVDPSSPFHRGALLGDRIRMHDYYLHPLVFIRSVASRGALGGLSPRILEMTDILRSAGFNYLFIETVGVGQSEVDIAGLADTTVVVLVPEAGDEIQTLKAGLMEIAQIFVVNKADRDQADYMVKNLRTLIHQQLNAKEEIPVIACQALHNQGIEQLLNAIEQHHAGKHSAERQLSLMADKVWHLIQQDRMKDITRSEILQKIRQAGPDINIYRLADAWKSPLRPGS